MSERKVFISDGKIEVDPAKINWGQYRKLPVVIQAVQVWQEFDVETLEGTMHGNRGDWLICGINGELYPCKPDVFAKTYEKAKP